MAKPNGVRRIPRTRHLESAARSSAPVVEKAAVNLFRWMTTDHTGTSKALANMPNLGVFQTLEYILMQLICGILGAVLSGVIAYVLIAYGIPLLFDLAFNG